MTIANTLQPMPSIMIMQNERTFLANLTENQKKFILNGQATCEAFEYSHFDAWGEEEFDENECPGIHDDEFWFKNQHSIESRNYHVSAMNEYCQTSYNFEQLNTLDASEFFLMLQAIYTESGYYAYLSDTMLEIYHPEDIAENYQEENLAEMMY